MFSCVLSHTENHIIICVYAFFFFTATATTEIYTLSLHDALPILRDLGAAFRLGELNSFGMHKGAMPPMSARSEEHTSELQSLAYLVCRLLLEKKKKKQKSLTIAQKKKKKKKKRK